MDSDFLRELIVLGVVVLLYGVGGVMLMRGHHVDLSAINGGGSTRRAAAGSGSSVAGEPRLNRRRKARLREAMERGEVQAEGNSTGRELADD
jgi:hypothetical protein